MLYGNNGLAYCCHAETKKKKFYEGDTRRTSQINASFRIFENQNFTSKSFF
jgi:hypothetical protein